jgi:hypothetical protein
LSTVLLIGAGDILLYNLSVGTDGPMATLIVFHVAAVAAALCTQSSLSYFLTSATTQIAGIVRPASYFLLGGLGVLLLFWRKGRLRFLVVMLAGVLVVQALATFADRAVRKNESESTLPWALFPHVAVLFDPQASKLPPTEAAALERAIRPFRAEWNNLDGALAKAQWEEQNFIKLNNAIFNELMKTWEGEPKKDKPLISATAVYRQAALETILHEPLGYLQKTLISVYSAYRNYALVGHAVFDGLIRDLYQRSKRDEPRIARAFPHLVPPSAAREKAVTDLLANPPRYLDLVGMLGIDRTKALALIALAAAVLFVPVVTGSRRTGATLLGSYCLILHFGGVLFVSLVTFFSPRYGLPLDMLLLVAIGCAIETVAVAVHRLMRLMSSKSF